MAPLVALLVVLGADAAWAQRIPGQSPRPSSIHGVVRGAGERPVPGAQVELRQRAASGRPVAFGDTRQAITSADGVFRFLDVPAGDYTITITHPQYQPLTSDLLRVGGGELVTTALVMTPVAAAAPVAPVAPVAPAQSVIRPRDPAIGEPLVPGDADRVFVRIPDRWNLTMPDWDRYSSGGDYPYVSGNWWDPYNQN